MKDELEMDINLPKIKYAVVGYNEEQYLKLAKGKKKLSAETVCIFYEDKTARIIDLKDLSLEAKEEEINNINKEIYASIDKREDYISLNSDSKKFKKLLKKAQNIQQGKDYSALKKAGAVVGVAGLAALAGATGYTSVDNLNNEKIEDELGKDLSLYLENGLDNEQKDLILKNITVWLEDVNAQENWMKTTLTEEQMKQYGLTDSECVFGFTAEDAYSLALRFGHYSNDEYVTLTGGKEMDTVAIMNDAHSQSNGALSSIISYYICSDECDLNIETLINFSDVEKAKIDEIEGKLREFKTLAREGKENEAKDKMVEIKEWFNEYAHSVDYEQDNAKSYILRTFLPACSALSQIYQYTDTIELDLYDTVNDVNTTKEIKTELFDEIMMRTLVLGFTECDGVGAFDAEAYLEEHNISNSRYNLLNTDITSSIADKSVSGQVGKLEQANIYIANLRNDSITANNSLSGRTESLIVNIAKGNIGEQIARQMDINNNTSTTYDELTYGTYEIEMLLEMVNNYLKENNIYPKNMNYFESSKLAEISMSYKDTHGTTQGKKGDTVNESHQKDVNIDDVVLGKNNVVLDKSGNPTTMEEAREEAREENEEQTGIYDASTPEAEQEAQQQAQQDSLAYAQLLDGVYNATFNYVYGSAVTEDGYNTANTYGLTYTASWATSSDPYIVQAHNDAIVDANAYKKSKQNAGTITGGQEIIYDQYQNDDDTVEVENFVNDEANTSEPEVQEPSTNEEVNTEDEGYSDVAPEDYAPVVSDYTEENIPVEESVSAEESIPTEDGYSDVAPEGFAPVVPDDTQVTDDSISYFSNDEILNYINTEEGNAWFESVTASVQVTDTDESVITK